MLGYDDSELSYGSRVAAARAEKKELKREAQSQKTKSRVQSDSSSRKKKAPELKLNPLSNSKHAPHSYITWGVNSDVAQELINRLNDSNLQILHVATGVGKTVLACESLGILQSNQSEPLKFVILASSAIIARGNWQSTLKSWNEFYPDNQLQPLMIETFDRFANILSDARSLREVVKLFGNDTILVIDEFHNYKSPMSKRSKTLKKLSWLKKIGLTATPLTNDVIMDGCSYLILAGSYTSKTDFMRKFGLIERVDRFGNLMVYNKAHQISERLWPEYSRFTEELSKLIYSPVIDMSDITMPDVKASVISIDYDERMSNNIISLNKAFRDGEFDSAMDWALSVIDEVSSSEKRLDKLIEIISQSDCVQPLVFYWHVNTLNKIRERLDSEEIGYQIISGSHSAGDVDLTRNDPILVQYQAGAEGIEMPRSNVSVFYQNQNSYSKLEQAKGRNVRRGHDHRVRHYYLVSDDKTDQMIFDRLAGRFETTMSVLVKLMEEGLKQ